MHDALDVKSANQVMRTTYLLLFISLLVTATTAYIGSLQIQRGVGIFVKLLQHPILISIVLVVSSIIFSLVNRFSVILSVIMFAVVTITIGLMLSTLGQVYSGTLIMRAVLSTAAVCAILTLASWQTHFNMAKFATQFFASLIVIIIVSLINALIFHSRGLSLIVSIASTIVFAGWFMIDTQRLKNHLPTDNFLLASLQLAYALYLDVINLFLHILHILNYFFNNNNN